MPVDDGKPFAYTPENRERLEAIAKRYPENPIGPPVGDSAGALSRAAAAWLRVAQRHPARRGRHRLHAADVEDVVSFYTMFYTRPVGKFVVQVCRTLPCALRGAERVTEELMAAIGTEPNGTDPSGMFTLMEVECLGACDRAPLVMVNDSWHECLQPEDAKKLVDDLRARGEDALTGCHHQNPERGPRTRNQEP